jgi:hypothetical protein
MVFRHTTSDTGTYLIEITIPEGYLDVGSNTGFGGIGSQTL